MLVSVLGWVIRWMGGWGGWVIRGDFNHVVIVLLKKATFLNSQRNKRRKKKSFIRDEQTTRKNSSSGNFSESCTTQICSGFSWTVF